MGFSCKLNPFVNLWAILQQQLRKQTVFWENFDEKVYEICKENDPDGVRNLYENYTKIHTKSHKLYYFKFVLLFKNL